MISDENSLPDYPYTRLTHFNEYLQPYLVQEKDINIEIPAKVIEDLKMEFTKQKIIIVNSRILHKVIKMCLRKLGYTKYYEYIPYIISKLTGEPPIILKKEDAEKLKIMFKQVLESFEQCKYVLGENRTSFIGYGYIFYRLCELLKLNNILQTIELPKSPLKLLKYDKVWKAICDMNGW